MNALMSFNILSVAILAESAKYPTTQPSSRDNAIWDALPQTLLPFANFWWRPIYLNKIFLLCNPHISDFHSVNILRFNLVTKQKNAAPLCFDSCGPFSPQMLLVKSDPHLQITASVTFWPTSKRHKYIVLLQQKRRNLPIWS